MRIAKVAIYGTTGLEFIGCFLLMVTGHHANIAILGFPVILVLIPVYPISSRGLRVVMMSMMGTGKGKKTAADKRLEKKANTQVLSLGVISRRACTQY